MDISKACLPPTQPTVSPAERKHPRFAEYQRYRASMAMKLVTADSFALWLKNIEEKEQGKSVVFHTQPGATLAPGWYRHDFAPMTGEMTRYGPFATREDAERA